MELNRLTPENITAIPADVRAALGIKAGDELAWQVDDGSVVMRPCRSDGPPLGTTVLDSKVFSEWMTDEDDDLV
jgi:AbrB family looped-hinge helix DNA binding protein